MFHINDVIMYGAQGVCMIADIEEKNISGSRKKYFVLKPIHDTGATIFAPTDNEHIRRKMRRLLTAEEINALIDSMPDEDAPWVVDESERKERYKNLIASGDHLGLLKMIKAIYAHKEAREREGKRLHISDERFFKDAEHILYNEFQYVLNLNGKDDLMKYIVARIESKACNAKA